MKRALLSLAILALFCFTTSEVYAVHLFGSREKVIEIYDLPNTEDYTSTEGELFDFGYKYTLFDIAFLPTFQKGEGTIVGYIDDDNYVLLSDDDIQNLAKRNDIDDLFTLVKLPFWDLWGGKIVLLALILLFSTLFILKNRYKKTGKDM